MECFKISVVILGMLSCHEVTAWLVSVVNETLGSTLSEFELFFYGINKVSGRVIYSLMNGTDSFLDRTCQTYKCLSLVATNVPVVIFWIGRA